MSEQKFMYVDRNGKLLDLVYLTEKKELGYKYLPVTNSDGKTRYALLGNKNDETASHLWVEKNGVKKYVIRIPNVTPSVYLTMGGYGDRYGFSNTGTFKFGAISGTFTYNSKTVTVEMFQFYDHYVSFVMQVDDETSGSYNANVTLIDTDTDKKGSIYFNGMSYQSYSKSFVGDQTLYNGDLYDFFSDSNIGKKYIIKVDIAKQ